MQQPVKRTPIFRSNRERRTASLFVAGALAVSLVVYDQIAEDYRDGYQAPLTKLYLGAKDALLGKP
ncbi:MAG: hypothetical protein OXR66_09115 [Candidatus Woesearchaeota archaeon]|nr:hypothetical protein [Candidatus Woesearchaeota archaeon]